LSSKAGGAIAERYSAALFDLAEEHSVMDAVGADLKRLQGLIAGSDELRRLFESPVVGRAESSAALVAIADKAGFDGLTRNFLGLVAANRRLHALGAIIEAFLDRVAAKRGEVTVDVVSAQPLDEPRTGALSTALKKIVGQNINLNTSVDPSLLGGLVVKIGSRMIDGSLKTKLQHLTLALKG
jgi:F-type H+-transporting ATPase subunit delta